MIYRILTFCGFLLSLIWFYKLPGFEPAIAIIMSIAAYFKDAIYGLIGLNFFSLTPKSKIIKNLRNFRFSFFSPEFINPKIIEDLEGWISDGGDQEWISDGGDQVVAINIMGSNSSNKYHGEVSVKKTKNYPIICCNEGGAYFSYQYIGCSFNGIHMIRTWSWGGGSGVFGRIIFLIITLDRSIDSNSSGKIITRDRVVIKKVGNLPLGDRYDGNISYKFGFLCIPKCSNSGPEPLRSKKSAILVF